MPKGGIRPKATCHPELPHFSKGLCVDHDHKTGEIRGLLCDSCNNGLGRFKDNPEILASALSYLQNRQVGCADVG